MDLPIKMINMQSLIYKDIRELLAEIADKK